MRERSTVRALLCAAILATTFASAAGVAYADTKSNEAWVIWSPPPGECLKVRARIGEGVMDGRVRSYLGSANNACVNTWSRGPSQLAVMLTRFKLVNGVWSFCTRTTGQFGDGWVYNTVNTWDHFVGVAVGDDSPCGGGTYMVQSNGQRNNNGWGGGAVNSPNHFFA